MAAKANVKTLFLWEGRNAKGERVKGEMSGQSAELIKAILRRRKIVPLKVRKKPKSLLGGKQSKITPGDVAIFSRQMATMMSSGVPLVQSFGIVADGLDNRAMAALINQVRNDIEGGTALGSALRRHPLYFDELFCNLVEAGEQSGALDTMLDKLAIYKEKTEALKAKIKKAMVYPLSILTVGIGVTVVLLIYVIPQFKELFSSFGGQLPAFTQLVVNLSEGLQRNFVFIAAVTGGVIYGFFTLRKRSLRFRHMLERGSLKIPVIGEILRLAAIARFGRTLSTMSTAGVPLVEAMDSVAGASGNVVFREGLLRIKNEISTGKQMNIAMRESELFPNMVVQMAQIGEEAGSLDSMLGKVADYFEEEVDNKVDALTSLMEPLIMVVLGVLVGGVVIAMYLPIFKMGSAIGG